MSGAVVSRSKIMLVAVSIRVDTGTCVAVSRLVLVPTQ
jgi:hypothetical protein